MGNRSMADTTRSAEGAERPVTPEEGRRLDGDKGAMSAHPDGGLRVLIVDDHELVRSGLRSLIELDGTFEVAGEAGTAEAAVQMVATSLPDVVVMDVRLPDRSGISACHEITTRFPDVKVLILTAFADEAALTAAVTARASGFLLKNVRASDIVGDLRRVVEGEHLFGQEVESSGLAMRFQFLSPQERILAGHLAEGLTNREAAERMGLAEKTVKNYVSNVLTKLGMERRSEAAAYVSRVQVVAGSFITESSGEARTEDSRRGSGVF